MAIWLRLAVLCICAVMALAAMDPPQPTTVPSPTPACTEGDRKADVTDCKKFTECKEGIWKPDSCFWFRRFDSIKLKCVMWGATCAK